MQKTFPCPKCGTPISAGQQTCRYCGEKFEYRCARCNATINTTSQFCINCGAETGVQIQQQPGKPSSPSISSYHKPQGYIYPPIKTQQKKTGPWLLILVITIFILGTVLYVIGTDYHPTSSKTVASGFTFQEKNPSPTIPPATETESESGSEPESDPEPAIATEPTSYTMEDVIRLARSYSPDCRKKVPG